MIKATFLVTRPPHMTHEEFVRYWVDVHAPIAAKMPGLRKYVINPARSAGDGGEAPYDGMAELSFDSVEAYQAGFGSPEGKETMDDAAKFIDMTKIRSMLVEEVPIV